MSLLDCRIPCIQLLQALVIGFLSQVRLQLHGLVLNDFRLLAVKSAYWREEKKVVRLLRCNALVGIGRDRFQLVGGLVVVRVSNTAATEKSGREHSDSTGEAHRDSPTAREPLADDAQHRSPVEALANREDRCGNPD